MIGRPALESARYLVKALELPITSEQYLSEREQLLIDRFPWAKPKPGARELVQHLHKNGVPQAVATSSKRAFFELKTQRHSDWFKLFDCVVTVDDPEVGQGKPAPDIFLTAARRLNKEPERCLVFEDAPSGMQAALAAGMAVIIVPDPNMDPALYAAADGVLQTLAEFEPARWQLPSY